MFAIGGIYNLYTNLQGNFCVPLNNKMVQVNLSDSENCTRNLPNALSLANKLKDQQAIGLQQWLNLTTVVALIIYFQYFRHKQRSVSIKLDENTVSPSDFTFVVSNVPIRSAQTIKNDLEEFFKTHGLPDKQQLTIKRIVLAYDVNQQLLVRKIEKIEETIKDFDEQLKRNNKSITLMDRISHRQKVRSLEKKLQYLNDEDQKSMAENPVKTVHGTAFITVNTQKGIDNSVIVYSL